MYMAFNFIGEISGLILAKYSIVYIHSWEESRIIRILETIAEKQFSKPMRVFMWSHSEGCTYKKKPVTQKTGAIHSIIDYLNYAISFQGNAIFIAKDLQILWKNDPAILRKLRDVYENFKPNHKTLFVVANQLDIPAELSKEISIYQFPFPDYKELKQVFDGVLIDFKEKRKVRVSLAEEDINAYIRSVMGLTLDEARRAYNKAFLETKHINRTQIQKVLLEKKFLIDKAPGLVYIKDCISLDEIGGLENLKAWLNQRLKCFTPEAKEFKIIPPKGLLITGISGCGKSFVAKGIAGLWDMPLIRLDMNQMYSIGKNAGENFENALKTCEAISPALLWIDEIENAISPEAGRGEGGRIFGNFLTWMQEKKSPVFVVATANNIDLLPAEMLRKGRFDEVFFVDLPTLYERESIFRLHMKTRDLEPGDYDLNSLTASTEGFSGSEIEQVVISAVFRGFMDGRRPDQDDFYKVISKTIPLSITLSEQIKSLKRWASQRAIFAGKAQEIQNGN